MAGFSEGEVGDGVEDQTGEMRRGKAEMGLRKAGMGLRKAEILGMNRAFSALEWVLTLIKQ